MDGELIGELVLLRAQLTSLDRRIASLVVRASEGGYHAFPPNCVDAEVAAMLPPQPATVGDEV
jgi:hypothetical protein